MRLIGNLESFKNDFAHFCPCPFLRILAITPKDFQNNRMGMGIHGDAPGPQHASANNIKSPHSNS